MRGRWLLVCLLAACHPTTPAAELVCEPDEELYRIYTERMRATLDAMHQLNAQLRACLARKTGNGVPTFMRGNPIECYVPCELVGDAATTSCAPASTGPCCTRK